MYYLKRATAALAILTASLSVIVTTSAAAPASAPKAAACSTAWGTGAESVNGMHTAGLVTTRAGKDPCFDRFVFEFAGTATGYRVAYANDVRTAGQGASLRPYTAGARLLSVTLQNPAYNAQGMPTYHHAVGDHVANVFGFPVLRDVVYGGSFEGLTIFAVGVRALLPFRVFHLTGPGAHHRIVVDVAHS